MYDVYNMRYVDFLKKIANLIVPHDKKPELIHSDHAFTNGTDIFLPFPKMGENTRNAHTFCVHEAFHILLTDFKTELKDNVFSKKTLHYLLNVVEDYRIEEYIKHLKPGYWFNFQMLHQDCLSERNQNVKSISKLTELISHFLFYAAGHNLENIDPIIYSKWIESNPDEEELFDEILTEMIEIFEIVKVKNVHLPKHHRKYPTTIDTIDAVKRIVFLLKKYKVHLDEDLPTDMRGSGGEGESGEGESGEKEEGESGSKGSSSEKEKGEKEEGESGSKGHSEDEVKPNINDLETPDGESTTTTGKMKRKKEIDPSKLEELLKKGMERFGRDPDELEKLNIEDKKPIKGLDELLDELAKAKSLKELDEIREKKKDFIEELDEKIKEAMKELEEREEKEKEESKKRLREAFMKKPEKERPLRKNLDIYEEEKVNETKIFDKKQLQVTNGIKDPLKRYNKIVQNNQGLIRRLESRFSEIKKGDGYRPNERNGRLSRKNLSRYVTSNYDYDRVYDKKDTEQEGANLLIVLDESGSMSGSRIYHAFESLVILTEALKGTKINFAIVGFSAYYTKTEILHKVYKDFSEPSLPEKIGCVNIGGAKENRDGTSFKFLFDQFLVGLPNPLMLIISDGSPWHGGTSYTNESGISHTKDAVSYIRKNKAFVYTLFIGGSDKEYTLKRMYGKDSYTILDSSRLQETLVQMLKNIVNTLR